MHQVLKKWSSCFTYMTNDLFLFNVVFLWLLLSGWEAETLVLGVLNNLLKICDVFRIKDLLKELSDPTTTLVFSSFSDSFKVTVVTSNLASWRRKVFILLYLACLLGRFWLVSDLDLACIEPTLVAIST